MSALLSATLEAARRCKVEVIDFVDMLPKGAEPSLFNDAWHCRNPRAIGWTSRQGRCRTPTHLHHELLHLVAWHPAHGENLPDGERDFLPWEYIVALTLGGPAAAEEWRRDWYTHETSFETLIPGTSTQRFFLVKDWEEQFGDMRESEWWHEGIAVCQRLGLLDAHGLPTWQDADWTRIGDTT